MKGQCGMPCLAQHEAWAFRPQPTPQPGPSRPPSPKTCRTAASSSALDGNADAKSCLLERSLKGHCA
eukprot:5546369-Lingulodinium_polyedra.AAC.1